MALTARSERGIALAIAVFSLMVVAALIGGAFFVSLQEQRLAHDARHVTRAAGAAEAGLVETVRTWDGRAGAALATYAAGSLAVAPRRTPFGTGAYHGQVYKLNDNLYFLDVSATESAGPLTRLGLLLRERRPGVRADAAFTTRGAWAVSGDVTIDGRDAVPNASWTSCEASGPGQAGIRVNGGVSVVGAGPAIAGAPPVAPDASVTDSTFTQLGDVTYDELAARADVTLPPGAYVSQPIVAGGVCERRPTNWGDGLARAGPCGDYLPVVHVRGDLVLGAGQGQGILLVDGDLDIGGPFQYFGIVLVRGLLRSLDTPGGAAEFYGAVLAGNAGGALGALTGGISVVFSKCAIQHALRAGSFVAPARSRAWTQLF